MDQYRLFPGGGQTLHLALSYRPERVPYFPEQTAGRRVPCHWTLPEAATLQKLESDPYFSGDKAQMALQKALLTLPEKQRMVFNLKYYQEMKYEQMSDIFGTSVGALKASYHHAVKKIEKILGEED